MPSVRAFISCLTCRVLKSKGHGLMVWHVVSKYQLFWLCARQCALYLHKGTQILPYTPMVWIMAQSVFHSLQHTCLPKDLQYICHFWSANLIGSVVKDPSASAGDTGSIPGLGGFPREENGNPLQYSCLGNPMKEEPGGLQSLRLQTVRHSWATKQQQHQYGELIWCSSGRPDDPGPFRLQ